MAQLRSIHNILVAVAATFAVVGDCFGIRGSQGVIRLMEAGATVEADVALALADELSQHGERMEKLEADLRPLFTALPKNEHGNVGHDAVRYALHRFFLQRYGWFIRGLEPSISAWKPQGGAKEWVPDFLQETLERRVGDRGSALHDVAAAAAALEDLIKHEGQDRLKKVYEVHGVDNTTELDREQVVSVLMTYYMNFLRANKVEVSSYGDLKAKKRDFARFYANYTEARTWFDETVARRLSTDSPGRKYDFNVASAAVSDIGENYHHHNEQECTSLKSTLAGLESRRAGRVRLSTFYNMSRSSHWHFTENREYLKSLGALDDSDPKNPSVIIANYAMARPNCLDAFHLYAVCCQNLCEDLMDSLERSLGAPAAEPSRIAALISELPSESVEAPRLLDLPLRAKLNEIADQHGGVVPIHGRLFSQWMHHAYPLECPYPHEGVNPQTASEWLQASGGEPTQATEEEMRRHVEEDQCAVNWQGKPECESESSALPWSMEERLLVRPSHATATVPAAPLPQAAPEPPAVPEPSTAQVVAPVVPAAPAASVPSGGGWASAALAIAALAGLMLSAPVALHGGGVEASELAVALGERPKLAAGTARMTPAQAKAVAVVSLVMLGYCLELINGILVAGMVFVAVAGSLPSLLAANTGRGKFV